MKKEFVPRKQAIALEELGFNEECLAGYNKETNELYISYEDGEPTFNQEYYVLAPLYQQAFRFFRENHGLWQIVMQNTDKDWAYDILPIIGIKDYKLFDVFDTYEEAEYKCLDKLIEIVKNKQLN
jgi:hypothetical protein